MTPAPDEFDPDVRRAEIGADLTRTVLEATARRLTEAHADFEQALDERAWLSELQLYDREVARAEQAHAAAVTRGRAAPGDRADARHARWGSGAPVITSGDVHDVLAGLQPLGRRAVALVYFGGCSPSETARLLDVEPREVAVALTLAFRHLSRWLLDDVDIQDRGGRR